MDQPKPSVNCRITGTFLGIEDHGILTFYINLDMDSSGMSFGGFSLSQHKDRMNLYSPACGEMIYCLLKVLEVDKWEDLPGKYCRIRPEPMVGDSGSDCELGHILKDKWLSLRPIAMKYKPA